MCNDVKKKKIELKNKNFSPFFLLVNSTKFEKS